MFRGSGKFQYFGISEGVELIFVVTIERELMIGFNYAVVNHIFAKNLYL